MSIRLLSFVAASALGVFLVSSAAAQTGQIPSKQYPVAVAPVAPSKQYPVAPAKQG